MSEESPPQAFFYSICHSRTQIINGIVNVIYIEGVKHPPWVLSLGGVPLKQGVLTPQRGGLRNSLSIDSNSFKKKWTFLMIRPLGLFLTEKEWAPTGERLISEPILGVWGREPPTGSRGRAHGRGSGGQSPPEAGYFFQIRFTFKPFKGTNLVQKISLWVWSNYDYFSMTLIILLIILFSDPLVQDFNDIFFAFDLFRSKGRRGPPPLPHLNSPLAVAI